MCLQCMSAAMGATATATGARSYLAARGPAWLTPRRLRAATVSLLAGALIASSLLVSGSSAAPAASPGAATGPAAEHAPAAR
jgi:hypothetical protein